MTPARNATQFDSVRAIYADVISNTKKDPVEQILAMTYEFDDQQLLNLISARPLEEDFELRKNHLKFIADLKPVIFYDARKTREFNRLPHFLELLPIKARPYSCHHSKAYLIVTQKTVRLVLGSLNLTYTGLFSNREVFLNFTWSTDATADLNVLRDFATLLRTQYANSAQAASSEAFQSLLDLLETRLASWSNGHVDSRYTLIASGPAASGMSQLAALWKRISATSPKRLFAVSPFYDQGTKLLADLLATQIGAARAMHFVTDQTSVNALSKRHYGQMAQVCILNVIPAEIADHERRRIEQANEGRPTEALHLERKLHAKILVLESDEHYLVYLGSANFTCKAWNGDNQELGVAWIEKGSPQSRIDGILRALSASTKNVHADLAEGLTPDTIEDDEDYKDEAGYPDFIERIVLHHRTASNHVQFEFMAPDLSRLKQYDICWGQLALRVDNGLSQELKVNEFYTRLLGGKNLRFVLKSDLQRTFSIPFWHSPELVRQKDLFLFPTSEDWLQFYLGIGRQDFKDPGECIPGDDQSQEPLPAHIEVDRDSNLVIQMQRYLSLFGRVEKIFAERAKLISSISIFDERLQATCKQIEEPILVYAAILKREYEREQNAETAKLVYCFKLGELALFYKSLARQLPELKPKLQTLMVLLEEQVNDTDPALNTYINYCNESA